MFIVVKFLILYTYEFANFRISILLVGISRSAHSNNWNPVKAAKPTNLGLLEILKKIQKPIKPPGLKNVFFSILFTTFV